MSPEHCAVVLRGCKAVVQARSTDFSYVEFDFQSLEIAVAISYFSLGFRRFIFCADFFSIASDHGTASIGRLLQRKAANCAASFHSMNPPRITSTLTTEEGHHEAHHR